MTSHEIQMALFRHYQKSGAIIAFNTQNVLAHEADVVVLRKSGVTLEIEVKISRSDFKADFRKVDKHKQMIKGYKHGPQYFYYACEEGLIKPEEVPDYAGLLYVKDWGKGYAAGVTEVKKAPRLHNHAHVGIHERLCRAMMFKAVAAKYPKRK